MKLLSSAPASVFAMGAVVFFSSVAHAADAYRQYTNARFGTKVLYPSNLLTQMTESDNGDGVRMSSDDGGVSFSVFASHNATGRTLRGDLASARNYWSKKGARTTYWKWGSNWFVTSGYLGKSIYYEKTVLKDNVFHTITWLYPSALRKRMDEPVTRSVGSFTGVNFIRTAVREQPAKTKAVAASPKPTPATQKVVVTPTRTVPKQNVELPAPADGY